MNSVARGGPAGASNLALVRTGANLGHPLNYGSRTGPPSAPGVKTTLHRPVKVLGSLVLTSKVSAAKCTTQRRWALKASLVRLGKLPGRARTLDLRMQTGLLRENGPEGVLDVRMQLAHLLEGRRHPRSYGSGPCYRRSKGERRRRRFVDRWAHVEKS